MPQTADVSDVVLIHRVVAGDSDAADLFVARFTRLVWWVLVHQVRLPTEPAGEVFQDVFVRLWQDNYRRLRNWSGEGDFAAYLVPIVRHMALDHVKGHLPERYQRFPDSDEPGSEPEDPAPGAGELAWIEQQRELLEQAIAALDRHDRRLYELRFVEERSYREISVCLGITVNNVGVRLSRLVDRLRAAVSRELGRESPRTGPGVRSPGPEPSSG
jgi:RNA polymerase sigma-70 factor (ECF subfamily)